MGIVYLARSLHTDVDVVLKAVRPEIAHRPDVRERTMAEGRALARIDHPNVVHLKSVVADETGLWLVMQYVEGTNLEDVIQKQKHSGTPMPLTEVLGIFRQVLAGVGAAHAEGVIHRDLKPANILIRGKDGVVKVTDFGIAKPEEDAQAGRGKTQGIIGSLNYMSPEQVRGQRDLDRRVDIYGLGIMLFEMLTGQMPFDSDNTYDLLRLHVEQPLPSALSLRPDLPPVLDVVLQQACAKDREQRFDGCDAFLSALTRIEAGAPTAPLGGYAPNAHAATAAFPSAQQPHPSQVQQPHPSQVQQASQGGYPNAPYEAARPGTITAQPATMAASPAPPRKSSAPMVAVLVALGLVAVGGTALFMSGVVSFGKETDDDPGLATTSIVPDTTAPATSSSAKSPLASLAGKWVHTDTGEEFNAVPLGDSLAFKIVDATKLGEKGYIVGETRFMLHPIEGQSTIFAVEDRWRPRPPPGERYDGSANARATCQSSRTEANGKPLRAKVYDNKRIDVDFANLAPYTGRNFASRGKKVTGCMGLDKLVATRLLQVFDRP